MGAYSYDGMDDYFMSHSILIVIHIFLGNVFLLNYYIALLSAIFEEGTETTGEFGYLTSKY